MAEFNLANTLLLAAYHKFKKPVTKVFPGQPVPVALDEDNRPSSRSQARSKKRMVRSARYFGNEVCLACET